MTTFISIMLGLLRIIGWVLLVIITILMVLLFIILWVPIRYDVEASADSKTKASIHISWFYKIFYYQYYYEKEKQMNGIMKFFGKTLYRKEVIYESKKNKKELHTMKSQSRKKSTEGASTSKQKEDSTELSDNKFNQKTKGTISEKDVLAEQETANELIEAKEKANKQAKGLSEEFEEQVEEKDSFGIKDFWEYPYKKEVIHSTYLFIKQFVKHLLPDVLKASGEIGMEDPAITGYIVGIFSIFSAFFGNDVYIVGNFQQKILKGSMYVKGKIYLGTIVKIIIMYIWKKPVRNIIRLYLRKRKDEAYGE